MSGELYTKYLAALDATAFDGRYVTHEPDGLPKSLHITWMAYRDMLEEFSREISNSLNDLTNYTHRLKAWGTVTVAFARAAQRSLTRQRKKIKEPTKADSFLLIRCLTH